MLYNNYQGQTLQIGGLNMILAYNLSKRCKLSKKLLRLSPLPSFFNSSCHARPSARSSLSFRLSRQGFHMLCQSLEIWELVTQENQPEEPQNHGEPRRTTRTTGNQKNHGEAEEPREPEEPEEPQNHGEPEEPRRTTRTRRTRRTTENHGEPEEPRRTRRTTENQRNHGEPEEPGEEFL